LQSGVGVSRSTSNQHDREHSRKYGREKYSEIHLAKERIGMIDFCNGDGRVQPQRRHREPSNDRHAAVTADGRTSWDRGPW